MHTRYTCMYVFCISALYTCFGNEHIFSYVLIRYTYKHTVIFDQQSRIPEYQT